MKINHPRTDLISEHDTIKALEDILLPGTKTRSRPCAGCMETCASCHSDTCLCHCSAYCRHVPHALSSEPTRYPIETAIAPLVYTLNSLGVLQPVWSCEGHDAESGRIAKFPQVWFYAKSSVHVQLLIAALDDLHQKSKLRFRWKINLNQFQQTLMPCYILAPELTSDTLIDIRFVRQDCYSLAAYLCDSMLAIANHHRQELLPQKRSNDKGTS